MTYPQRVFDLKLITLPPPGVFTDERCIQIELNHAVNVVGYGTLQGKDYW